MDLIVKVYMHDSGQDIAMLIFGRFFLSSILFDLKLRQRYDQQCFDIGSAMYTVESMVVKNGVNVMIPV